MNTGTRQPRAADRSDLGSVQLATEWLGEPALVGTGHPQFAVQMIDLLLKSAAAAGASDVHIVPMGCEVTVGFRVRGVLEPVATIPSELQPNLVGRLKVISELLTYRMDVPQEGRIRESPVPGTEMRVTTFPTIHGEKLVIRLFSASQQFGRLTSLRLPDVMQRTLLRRLEETSGALLLTGPTGSGKTTTAYACLRERLFAAAGRQSLVSLEDPVEAVIPGVAQSAVQREQGLTYARGLQSLLRQDPDVILVGEIRDRETAAIVCQAALTGQLVLSTFHAATAASAIGRLLDMDIEPYVLRNSLIGITCQRLVRALCSCATVSGPGDSSVDDPSRLRQARGCPACRLTGYNERFVVAECLDPRGTEIGPTILSRGTVAALEAAAVRDGLEPFESQIERLLTSGQTSLSEITRVYGGLELPRLRSQVRMP